ncbi:MAG: hypothetical protein JWM14_2127 [Chitinophagaceae bacterium]|nr:hypothetical protein [Chitinophagaceae bacterium]
MLHATSKLFLLCALLSLASCEYNKGEDLGADGPPVVFSSDIKPIIINNCVMCHSDTATNPDKPDPTLHLFFLQGAGDFSILQQKALQSSTIPGYTLIQARLHHLEEPYMPFNRPQLPDSLIKKIDRWVKQGAPLN